MNLMTEVEPMECAAALEAPIAEMEEMVRATWLQSIPWKRVLVDALLVLAIVLASSSFLSVR